MTAGVSAPRLKELYGEELPLFKKIREEGVRREQPLLVETLIAVASGKIRLPLPGSHAPLCLNTEVDSRLERGYS